MVQEKISEVTGELLNAPIASDAAWASSENGAVETFTAGAKEATTTAMQARSILEALKYRMRSAATMPDWHRK